LIAMPVYEIYGRELHTDLALPELSPPDGCVRFAPLRFEHRLPLAPPGGWFTIWYRPDGLPWVRAARTAHGYHVQYRKCADFSLDLRTGVIAGAAIDCADDMFRHFLVDQIVPMMLSVGDVVLHASAVSIDGAVAAFAGPGGSGKSTIAMALSRLGHAIVSDDGVLLARTGEHLTAIPAYSGIRLWPDSEAALVTALHGARRRQAHAKRRFREGVAFGRAAALTHLYVLAPGASASVAFEPLTARDAAVEMVRQCFRLALDDREALARQLDALAAAAPSLSAWRLSYPRALAGAAARAGEIAAHVRASHPAARAGDPA
jgi:hypothetical protein